jgi:hypothetical protein
VGDVIPISARRKVNSCIILPFKYTCVLPSVAVALARENAHFSAVSSQRAGRVSSLLYAFKPSISRAEEPFVFASPVLTQFHHLTFFNIFDDDVDVRSACTHLALLG